MRRLFGSLFFAVALIMGGATQTFGSTEAIQKRLFELLNSVSEMDAAPSELRLKLSEIALEYWQSFDERVPQLTYEQEQSLAITHNTPMRTLQDYQRWTKAVTSPEFELQSLKELTQNCVSSHKKLVEAIGADKAEESTGWLKVASCYNYGQLSNALNSLGLSNGRADGEFKMQYLGYMLTILSSEVAAGIERGI